MTQNEIEKKLKGIETTLDKMSANYDRTLSDLMVEQQKQKTCKTATDSLNSIVEKEKEKENDVQYKKFTYFLLKLGLISCVVFIGLVIIAEILKLFIPIV